LEGGVVAAQGVEVLDDLVHEAQVVVGEGAALALEGEDELAGEDVLGEGAFEEVVAAQAGAARREEADVVVLGPGVPGRGEGGRPQPEDEPGPAHHPGPPGGEATEPVEHARHPFPGEPHRGWAARGNPSGYRSAGQGGGLEGKCTEDG